MKKLGGNLRCHISITSSKLVRADTGVADRFRLSSVIQYWNRLGARIVFERAHNMPISPSRAQVT